MKWCYYQKWEETWYTCQKAKKKKKKCILVNFEERNQKMLRLHSEYGFENFL